MSIKQQGIKITLPKWSYISTVQDCATYFEWQPVSPFTKEKGVRTPDAGDSSKLWASPPERSSASFRQSSQRFLGRKQERKKKRHKNSLGAWSLSLQAGVKISSAACLQTEQEAASAQPGVPQGLWSWTESHPCSPMHKVDLLPCCLQILCLVYSLGKTTIKATILGSKTTKMGPSEFLTVFTRALWTASRRQRASALRCGRGTGYWYEWEKGKIKRSC